MRELWPSVGEFLREHRRLIPRDATALGPFRRLPVRHGKAVTQEEIAEALGVSRVWYSMLESGAALNTSLRLLTRLADAFSLSGGDREALFHLALPALRTAALSPVRDDGPLQSMQALRLAMRRIWWASSEAEIMGTVTEAVSAILPDADSAGTFRRIQPGRWEYPIVLGGDRFVSSLHDLHEGLRDGFTPEQIDDVMLHGSGRLAGKAGARAELHRNVSVQRRIARTFESAGFASAQCVHARIRSDNGFEGAIFAHYAVKTNDFSELDHAALDTLADLATLALSPNAPVKKELFTAAR
jgi:transcriptional regulator with XRE-family HTH domain